MLKHLKWPLPSIVSFITLVIVIIENLPLSSAQNETDGGHPLDAKTGYCVVDNWSSCGTGGMFGANIPCKENRQPQRLGDNDTLELLAEICPELMTEDDPLLCCSKESIETLSSSYELPKTLGLGRCPSCMHNFRKNFCQFTCSPRQNQFLKVNKTTELEDGRLKVDQILYYMTDDFATNLYDSCKGIQGVTTGTYVMSFLCGSWGHSECSPHRWLEFMGLTMDKGGYSPFEITYIFTNETDGEIIPMNEETISCKDAPPGETRCSCRDCELACHLDESEAPSLSSPPGPLVIGPFSLFIVIAFVSYLAFAASVFLYFITAAVRKRRSFSPGRMTPESIDSEKSRSSTMEFKPLNSPRKNTNDFDLKTTPSQCSESISNERHFNNSSLDIQPLDVIFNQLSLGLRLEMFFQKLFQRWGVFVGRHPWPVILSSLVISLILAFGVVIKWQVTTDPIDLWVASGSRARQDMEYFNKHFWKFYRVEQVILEPKDQRSFEFEIVENGNDKKNVIFGPVFKFDFLKEAFKLQLAIQNLSVDINGRSLKLDDICFKPLGDNCATQSLFTFFMDDITLLRNTSYLEHIASCTRSPVQPNNPEFKQLNGCFKPNGIPLVYPEVALGGFEAKNYTSAKALILTFPVVNHYAVQSNFNASLWEKEFLRFIGNESNYNSSLLTIAYKAERSIEDELDRQSQSDIVTVVASYLIMFIYILLALGDINKCNTILLDAKFSLGFIGVTVVLLSVLSSLGFFFYLNVPATLIIVEVIPFLVLAVGVDNVFILVQAFQRDEKSKPEGEEFINQIGRVVGEVAPSMMLSSAAMSACFFIGALTEMPAVKLFALYAGVALIINFFLQMTCFLGFFVLDTKRQASNRLDILFCIKAKKPEAHKSIANEGLLYTCFKDIYTPFLMKDSVRLIVLLGFGAWLCSSIAVLDKIHIGLEQDLSMPEDSYMINYFDFYQKYFVVGPPVYFMITEGFDYSDDNSSNAICALPNCDRNSLPNLLGHYVKSKRSFLSAQPTPWYDSFSEYIQSEDCCYYNETTGERCVNGILDCKKCYSNKSQSIGSILPKFITHFLDHPPDNKCPKGGRGQFNDAIEYVKTDRDAVIKATYLMTYRTPLKTSKDFYESLRTSREIANILTRKLQNSSKTSSEVRTYSFPDVFYEQYLTMWPDTIRSLSISIIAIFIVTFLFLGLDIYSALIVALTILMITIDLMGLMYWWDISLNAISLVNLVVSVGISVEFCSHLVRCYAISLAPTKILRAKEALDKMGTSILSGITLTDCGILVLAFAKSKIFRVFYFRMYLGIIAFGTLHSLILLPVLLSVVGPPLNKQRLLMSRLIDSPMQSPVRFAPKK